MSVLLLAADLLRGATVAVALGAVVWGARLVWREAGADGDEGWGE